MVNNSPMMGKNTKQTDGTSTQTSVMLPKQGTLCRTNTTICDTCPMWQPRAASAATELSKFTPI